MGYLTQFTAAVALLFFSTIPAMASDTVLTVSGVSTSTETTATYEYAFSDLRGDGEVTFTTTTPWTEGEQTFTGVPLSSFVSSLGIKTGKLRATAVNDYSVEIPISDALLEGPIIAFLRNDERMSVREKGPLWIVYPYDSNAKFRTEIVYSRSIWQLDRIVVSE
ncbi:oxidoreductase [Aliisedimentitalea scapharcae]|uniref:Oxidoreductase n=1 Tax=Aliisedimentitalea scapharcae TaxID=1524259 RepID=A0ABZ2XUF7_9RHOB|nr:oxidoreductase [Rhodobacteraceae bacterium M382]